MSGKPRSGGSSSMAPDFVVGTGRCGSTFVHEVLARHEAFGFVANIEDNLPWLNRLGRFNSALYRSPLGRHTAKGGLRFAPSEAYQLIGREVSPIYVRPARDLRADDVTPWLAERFQRFFGERAQAQGKARFTHKYTGWSRIGFFDAIFPAARFVHVVRDGRAVVNSWLQMPWWDGYSGPESWLWGALAPEESERWNDANRSFALLGAIGWRRLMESYDQAGSSLPAGRILTLRHEDVLARPRDSFVQLLDFLALPLTRAFERELGRTVVRVDRARAFERDLTPDQVALIDAEIGPLLVRHGYC
jgi:hypothetical protein